MCVQCVCSSLKGHSCELDFFFFFFFWVNKQHMSEDRWLSRFPQNGCDATSHQSTDWARCCFLSERKKAIMMKIFIYWEGWLFDCIIYICVCVCVCARIFVCAFVGSPLSVRPIRMGSQQAAGSDCGTGCCCLPELPNTQKQTLGSLVTATAAEKSQHTSHTPLLCSYSFELYSVEGDGYNAPWQMWLYI